MGCNTSKETLSQTGGESGEAKENTNEEPNEENTKPEESNNIKLTKGANKQQTSASEEYIIGIEKTTELEEAAVKIQTAFRRHQTKNNMKQPAKQEEVQPSEQRLEEEFDPNDKELCEAATKIQASFRGHMIRKQIEKTENISDDSKEGKHSDDGEELDMDFSDPDLNKAAVKIQASFRGHMARKEHDLIHNK